MSIFLKILIFFLFPVLASAQTYKDQEFLARALASFKDGFNYEFTGVLAGTQRPCNLKFEKNWAQGRLALHSQMHWAVLQKNQNNWMESL